MEPSNAERLTDSMYEKFFQFKESPFNLTPDPRFFFFSKKHEDALENVLYGVKQRKGFIVLSGEVGTGKTSLCRLLLERFDAMDNVRTALIFNPSLTTVELLQAINKDFGLPDGSASKGELVDALNRFLLKELSRGGNALLTIDEAQNLSTESMEEIRMLSNLETNKEKLLQILLVGQPELRDKLALPGLRQFNQRVTLRYHIEPLDLEETRSYIQFRLQVAGGQDRVLFTPKAVERIYRVSQGIPRLINAVCDKSLLAAFVSEISVVNEDCVDRAARELPVGEPGPPRRRFRSHRRPDRRARPFLTPVFSLFLGAVVTLGVGLGLFWNEFGRFPMVRFPGIPQLAAEPAGPTSSGIRASAVPESAPDPSFPGPPGAADEPEDSRPGDAEGKAVSDPAETVPEGFDSGGVYRVSDPDKTKSAAVLTLLGLWGVTPREVPAIGKVSDTEFAGLLESNGFRSYDFEPNLPRLRALNYPCIIQVKWNEDSEATFAVLAGLSDTEAVVLDPLAGNRTLPLGTVQSLWEKEALLVWKPDTGITLPLEKDSTVTTVRAVQKALKKQGYFKGEVDGILGPRTLESVRFFQRKSGLKVDGVFGIESYLTLFRADSGVGRPGLEAKTL